MSFPISQSLSQDSADDGTAIEALPEIAAIIARDAARRERDRELPHEAFGLIRSARLGALRVPTALGGPGASIRTLLDAITRLAAADSNVAHALRSHFNFVELILLGPQSRRDRYLDAILKGDIIGGAHTELDTTRPGEIRTRLSPHGDGFRLDGQKYYATGAVFADRLFVTAVDGNERAASVALDPRQAGITILDDWDGMGQRLTSSGGIRFDNVKIAHDDVEWQDATEQTDGAGRHAATFRQLYLAACQAGIVRNILSDASEFVRTKARTITHSHTDNAVDDFFVQRTIGAIAAKSFAVDALIEAAAHGIDLAHAALIGGDRSADRLLTESAVATAKAQTVIAELALSAASGIFDTGGGSATSRALNFDRHWRNIRTLVNHNPLDYKLQVIGANVLNNTAPPLTGGFF